MSKRRPSEIPAAGVPGLTTVQVASVHSLKMEPVPSAEHSVVVYVSDAQISQLSPLSRGRPPCLRSHRQVKALSFGVPSTHWPPPQPWPANVTPVVSARQVAPALW